MASVINIVAIFGEARREKKHEKKKMKIRMRRENLIKELTEFVHLGKVFLLIKAQ